jgi:hypothetical protein
MLQMLQKLQVLRMLQEWCWNMAIGDDCFWKQGWLALQCNIAGCDIPYPAQNVAITT